MDNHFKALLTRYLDGTCTVAEREQVEHWYSMIEDRTLVLTERERRVIGERMLENIVRSAAPARKPVPLRRRSLTAKVFKIAASLIIPVACCVWYFNSDLFMELEDRSRSATVLSSEVTIRNDSNIPTMHRLPDSSVVRLEVSSRIRYNSDFATGGREVHLVGEAFFDIVRDPSHPFFVYAGEIGTRVLGTSFFVEAPEQADRVGVKVLTGKVSVFKIDDATKNQPASRNSTPNGVILSPNEKVEYYVSGGHWVTGLVEDPVPVKPLQTQTSAFVFSNARIGNILTEINDFYGIEVISENERINECMFTGDVSMLSLFDMLDVICNAIGSTFEVKGTRILISGEGCEV